MKIGDRVTVEIPTGIHVTSSTRAIGRATRQHVRTFAGIVTLVTVRYEPGMIYVRPDGANQAMRVLKEHCTMA